MEPKASEFSFEDRAAEKSASRANDQEKLLSGEVSRAEMSRINGGYLRDVRYVGPSKRIRDLAED